MKLTHEEDDGVRAGSEATPVVGLHLQNVSLARVQAVQQHLRLVPLPPAPVVDVRVVVRQPVLPVEHLWHTHKLLLTQVFEIWRFQSSYVISALWDFFENFFKSKGSPFYIFESSQQNGF